VLRWYQDARPGMILSPVAMLRSKDCWHDIKDIQALYGTKGENWRDDLAVECRAGKSLHVTLRATFYGERCLPAF
jgi:hypothetical protein